MAGVTTFATLSPKVQGFYDTRALIRYKKTCVAASLGQKKTLPEGKGSTVNFFRYKPLLKNTTAMTEAADGGIPTSTRQQFTTQEVTIVPYIWSDFVPTSILASLEVIDQSNTERIDVVNQQAFESLDYMMHKSLGTGMLRRRADGDTNYQVAGTSDAAGTTLTVVDSTRTATDAGKPGIGNDYYLGGFITITNPASPAYGQTRQITGYTAASGTFTVGTAFTVAPGTAASYRVAVGTGIGSSATINSRVLRLAGRDLRNNAAQRFEKGMFKSILGPDMHYDFFDDPNFVRAGTDKDRTDYLETNEVGRFAGTIFAESTQLYRETVAGVEADGTGAVHIVPFLGKEAFGVVSLGEMSNGEKNFKTYIRTWEQLGQAVPQFDTIGYQARIGWDILNGCFGVGIMCGASDNI